MGNEDMEWFYYNETISEYEKKYKWNEALKYLDRLYYEKEDNHVIYSLIGFAWYYFVEGPLISGIYWDDEIYDNALDIWKKYIDIGMRTPNTEPFFCYISGYTLGLHGFFLGKEYYEGIDIFLMNECIRLTDNPYLRALAENYLTNTCSKKYVCIDNANEICQYFFSGYSLLDKYFNYVYLSKHQYGRKRGNYYCINRIKDLIKNKHNTL